MKKLLEIPGYLRCLYGVNRWDCRIGLSVLVFELILAFWFWLEADESPLSTAMLFGPRWVFVVPVLFSVAFSLLRRSATGIAINILAGLIFLGPVSGYYVSWGGMVRNHDEKDPASLRIMSCNCEGSISSRKRLIAEIVRNQADIVFLQESPALEPKDLPEGWTLKRGPTGSTLLSRFPIEESKAPPTSHIPVNHVFGHFTLKTPAGPLSVMNLHLPTPREGMEALVGKDRNALSVIRESTQYRALASASASSWARSLGDVTFVAGDFNMPVESQIYRRDWSRYENSFSTSGMGWGYTKHTRTIGVRIDHILYISPWKCRLAWVGRDIGSDHLPVIAEFVMED